MLKQIVMGLVLLAATGGCMMAPDTRIWSVWYVPTTEAERTRVASELRTLTHPGSNIRETYKVVCEMWCHPTIWEWSVRDMNWTGRWGQM